MAWKFLPIYTLLYKPIIREVIAISWQMPRTVFMNSFNLHMNRESFREGLLFLVVDKLLIRD